MAKVTTSELAKYAVDEIEAGTSSSNVAQKIAAFLLEERRSRDHAAVMRAIDEELAKRGSPQVVITSAFEVSIETKKQLAGLLDVKNPVFSDVIDKNVIGGVKARSGDSEIDLTVRARMNKFKATIVSGK